MDLIFIFFVCIRARDCLLYPSLLFILYFQFNILQRPQWTLFLPSFCENIAERKCKLSRSRRRPPKAGRWTKSRKSRISSGVPFANRGRGSMQQADCPSIVSSLCNKGCYSPKRRSIYEGKKMEHSDPFLSIAAKFVHGLQR